MMTNTQALVSWTYDRRGRVIAETRTVPGMGVYTYRMGYNSANYIHTLYQAMNLSFADRDFYYGDPYFPPEEPIKGLLSKDYARDRGLVPAGVTGQEDSVS